MPALSPHDVDAFLAEPGHLARIGTIDDDGMPRVLPLWFIVHDGAIFRSGTPDSLAADEDVKRIYLGADFRLD